MTGLPTVTPEESAAADQGSQIIPRGPLIMIDGFLPLELATVMREDIDRHFAEPLEDNPRTHQVWDYLFAPRLYTYMRTSPEKIINSDRIALFCDALKAWSTGTLGMGQLTRPYLRLYVAGCSEAFHNEPLNGRFGFVYSLTRDARRTVGGETLVMREGDSFRAHLTNSVEERTFCDVIAPRFNRLLVFDDRLIRAVSPVRRCASSTRQPTRCDQNGKSYGSGGASVVLSGHVVLIPYR